MTNISLTMSDSAATEVKFNSLLEEYRAAVLPYTLDNYNDLDEDGKLSLSRLNIFSVACTLLFTLLKPAQNYS